MLRNISLDEKYTLLEGRALLSGPQALTRLPMIQHLHDRSAGLNTGGFISGYQGSPITNYDLTLAKTAQFLQQHNIVFRPAVNEELAATSCWGTQQLGNFAASDIQGVFALWYGKGPGVDRATDAIKHGNHSGTHPRGGVLAVFGDDHAAKSSTVAHNSEPAMAAMSVPVIYPANVGEFIEFGLFGWAMSRYTGLWTGFKTVNETMEQTATVDLDMARSKIVVPQSGIFPPEGVHYNSAYTPARDDVLVTRYKLPLVHLFARANPLDRTFLARGSERRLGIVTAGKLFQDVREALTLLGLDEARAAVLGVSIYKLGLIWPIEPQGLRAFAEGLEELLVIEEKKPFLEPQIASILYNAPNRPRLIGKRDEHEQELFPSDVTLDPVWIANVIGQRLREAGRADEQLLGRLQDLAARLDRRSEPAAPYARTAFYCSGCPHNTSTKLPEGSQGMGGIGCHGMATFTRTDTLGVTQMGGEGATWIGASPFVKTKHVFQNLGDGTYYHSGLLAIRATVAAGVNVTYKILYNDATAMTGGQPIAGPMSVGDITRQVLAEGVRRVVVVTDRPELYGPESLLAPGTQVLHRDHLATLQRELREVQGVSVIVYEQTCAAEKRRRRKRKEFPDPPKRMFINDAVCEGCGDCSAQSNCMSLVPVETAMGRKRAIDQSTCNKDFSCVNGFCPSFVTVHGGHLKKPKAHNFDDDLFARIPNAIPSASPDRAVMVAGIGGTGVVTIGAVLAMAAHIEGRFASSYDMTGMAQKGGAVYSHIRISGKDGSSLSQKISTGEADVLIGCDLVASSGGDAFQSLSAEQSYVIANTAILPTAEIQKNVDATIDSGLLTSRLSKLVGDRLALVDANAISSALLGDTIGSNFFLVGVAQQQGCLGLSADSILQAIRTNATAVLFNQAAFNLGRLWVHDRAKLEAIMHDAVTPSAPLPMMLGDIREHRVALLRQYQNDAYANRYTALVDLATVAEVDLFSDRDDFAKAVAVNFAKLMAYKDEYEVARLYADPAFKAKLKAQFEGNYRLAFNLAPPAFAGRDPVSGHLHKREYGAWVFPAFHVLAWLRFLRGTALDLFGYADERRTERAWIVRYEKLIREVCGKMNAGKYEIAVQIAQIPELIRGFGHVKARNWKIAEQRLALLERQLESGDSIKQAAE